MSRDRQIHVGGSFEDAARRFVDAWHRAELGETVGEEHLTFLTWDAFAGTMTAKRLELLRHLHRQPSRSIAALARNLGRDYKRVHADVEALEAIGLIERNETGLHADYDEIRTAIAM
ncbi:MAG: HVO_A0114 family putative DNA-binding protein [Pararhizobium sp.]